MTCLEAQSKIITYIDYNLDKEQKIEFLKHIQCCENCREELDIYYTIIEGMRQMDSNIPLTKGFSEKLELRIRHDLKQNRQIKNLIRSLAIVLLVGIFSASIFAYVNFWKIADAKEQIKLKEEQGEYYYSTNIGPYLFFPDKNELVLNLDQKETEMTFYEKIRYYNLSK